MSDVAPNDFPQDEPTQQPAFSATHTLGQRLAAEREARGWTIDYVAGQLNLATRQIQALEDENYAALPGIASVRGFVRAYAKLLKVEADPLVALIASEQIAPNLPLEPKPNLSSAPFSHSRLSGGTGPSNSIKGAAFALVVVLLAAGAIGIEHMGGWPTLSQSLSTQFKDLVNGSSAGSQAPADGHDTAQDSGTPVKSSPDANDATAKDGSQANTSDEHEAAKDVPAPVMESPAPVQPAPAHIDAPTPAPAVVASAPAPAPVQPAPQVQKETPPATQAKPAAVAAPGTAALVLTARQNSWIDVRAGSNVIASHLLKAGDTETIDVPGTAQLTVGNAAGVDATFRGQPLSTKTDGKTNVARITLK
jgi:cytoskeleton protein RodZ